MVKKKTSIIIDDKLWKELKKHCTDEEIDMSVWIENKIREELK